MDILIIAIKVSPFAVSGVVAKWVNSVFLSGGFPDLKTFIFGHFSQSILLTDDT